MPDRFDFGECTATDNPTTRLIHTHILNCEKSIQKLRFQRSGYSFDEDFKGQQALCWLREQAPQLDCTRFLLKAKSVLWDNSGDLYPSEGIYWETCASLFSELLARQSMRDDIKPEEILDTLIQRFINTRGDPWAARAYLIRFLGDFGTLCPSLIALPNSQNNKLFWEAMDLFMCYLEAAFDCVSHSLLPTNLILSLRYFTDSWFRIVTSLTSEKGGNIHHDTQREITYLAVCRTLNYAGILFKY